MTPGSDLDFWGHLGLLQRRLVVCVLFFIAAFLMIFPFSGRLVSFFLLPVGSVVFTAPVEAFSAHCTVTLLAAFLVSLPLICFQIWSFVAEGLTPSERGAAAICGAVSCVLFAAGAVFAYAVVVPLGLKFFLGFSSPQLVPMIRVSEYFSFLGEWVIAFGVAFQMPVVLFALARFGVVLPSALARGRRYAVVAILFISAVLTPPDVASQLMLACPMIILYEAGILLARLGAGK